MFNKVFLWTVFILKRLLVIVFFLTQTLSIIVILSTRELGIISFFTVAFAFICLLVFVPYYLIFCIDIRMRKESKMVGRVSQKLGLTYLEDALYHKKVTIKILAIVLSVVFGIGFAATHDLQTRNVLSDISALFIFLSSVLDIIGWLIRGFAFLLGASVALTPLVLKGKWNRIRKGEFFDRELLVVSHSVESYP